MSREKALAAKKVGNSHFSKGEYEQAIKAFTEAISFDATDHVFFSNRSASYANMESYDKALEDANQCVSLKPDWAKGYSRKGLALYHLKQFPESLEAYEGGLKINPSDAACTEGAATAKKAMENQGNPLASLFGPQMWGRLAANPQTRGWLEDPEYVQKLKMLQANPQNMGMMQSDPRIQQSLGVILGLGADFANGGGQGSADAAEDAAAAAEAAAKEKEEQEKAEKEAKAAAEAAAKKAQEEEDAAMTEEEREEKRIREEKARAKEEALAKANVEKATGNDHYKNRRFEEALKCYAKAVEICPTNMSYLANSSAVLWEQKKYEDCLETCKKAIEVGRQNRGDFKLLAKTYGRMGNVYVKLDNLDDAVKAFENSLLEDTNDKIKRLLKSTLAKKKKKDEEAYLSDELSLKAKAEGNEFFKAAKWVDAIGCYTEAIKRNPKAHAVYSNRAACYTKLMDWQRALDDCDMCMKLEPTFVKAYIRKGKVEHFLKKYHKALETYQKGLDLDPNASELKEGLMNTQRAIQRENQSGEVDPRRAQEAMKDPEIQQILNDPEINNVLKTMQTNPQGAQNALRNPVIMGKINKLVAAGIVRLG